MKIKISHRTEIAVIDNYYRHNDLKEDILDALLIHPDMHGRKTNVKATMTEWNMKICSNEIEILKEYILNYSETFFWSGVSNEFNPTIVDFWANIYRNGDHANLHDHIPSDMSFVYFLKSPKKSSPLIFHGFFGEVKIKPKEGRMLFFPSYLKHMVPPYKGESARITIGANVQLLNRDDTKTVQ